MKKLMLTMIGAPTILFAAPLPVAADISKFVSGPACGHLIVAGCNDGAKLENGYLTGALDAVAYVAGFLAVLFLIIGAVRYITSTGDSTKIQSAKNTVIYSIVGLVLVILARAIIGYVINSLNGA